MLFTLSSLIIEGEEGFYFAKKGQKGERNKSIFSRKKIEKEDEKLPLLSRDNKKTAVNAWSKNSSLCVVIILDPTNCC